MKNIALIVAFSSLLFPFQVRGADDVFAQRKIATKKEAVILSALFPGLGQISKGQKIKGTIILVAEIGSLAAALTANENYKTRFDNFTLLKSEYQQMAAGSSQHDLAQQKWEQLEETNADLDDLHLIRRVFGAAAVGIYAYNLIDILLSDSHQGAATAAGWELKVLPGLPGTPSKLMVMASF